MDTPLFVGVDHISDPSVRVRNLVGLTPAGLPYYDLTDAVGDGAVDPGETVAAGTLVFYNPDRIRFTYDLIFFGQLNEPPNIQSTPVTEILGGSRYQSVIAATDPDGDDVQFSLQVGPSTMTVDPASGQIQWNTTPADRGSHFVSVQAADDRGGATQQQFMVSVLDSPPNRPPVFTSVPDVTANVNAGYVYAAAVADADGDALSFTLTAAPAGASLNPTTGRITWQPTLAQFGVNAVSLEVTDGRGGLATQAFVINVAGEVGNQEPVFVSDPITEAIEGQDYVYDAAVLDPDGDDLGFRLLQSPAGMAISAATGQISWPAPALQLGSHQVQIEVADGRGGFSTQQFTLQALANRAPAFTSTPPLAATAEQTYGYFAKATDADGDDVTFALSVAPAGMTIDADSGLVTWTPTAAQVGANPVVITATDEHGAGTAQSFNVAVGQPEANQDPAITSTALLDAVAERLYEYLVIASDPNGEFLTYQLVDAPDGMTIDPFTGRITWVPSAGGTYTPVSDPNDPNDDPRFEILGLAHVTVQATDVRGGSGTQDYDILVRAIDNLPPTFDSIPPAEGTFGELYRYQASALDPDGDVLVFELLTVTSTQNFVSVSIPPTMAIGADTGVLAWTPQISDFADFPPGPVAGIKEVLLRVTDGKGGVDVQQFPITVGFPNEAPVITSTPPAQAVVNFPVVYRVQAQDANLDTLTYTLDTSPAGMVIDSAGVIVWTPSVAQVGSNSVSVKVSDGELQATQSFDISVVTSAINTEPIISSSPRTAIQLGGTYLYQVNASDTDSDPLTLSLPTAPAGMTLDPDTGLISWQPDNSQLGTHPVEVRASDARGGLAVQPFDVQVVTQDSNLPPRITSTPGFGVTVGDLYSYDLVASDPDGDVIVFELADGPLGMSLDGTTGSLRWTPLDQQIGTHDVAVNVLDSQGSIARQSWSVTARATNQPPAIFSTPTTQAAADQLYVYAVGVSDPDGDAVQIDLLQGPTGLTLGSSTGLIQWTPTLAQLGSHDVEIQVADPFGAQATQSFAVEVLAEIANRAPVITSAPPLSAAVNLLYTYGITASDPESGVTFELVSGPTGMSVNPATGLLSWTPSVGQAGSQPVSLAAVDVEGARSVQSFSISVRGTNQLPQITGPPKTTGVPGVLYSMVMPAVDPDGDPPQYNVETGPNGLTIDQLGLVTWTPTQADVGSHPVSLTAGDAFGLVRLSYTLSIQTDLEAPQVQIQPSENPAQIGSTVTILVASVDDVGIETLTLTANGAALPLDATGRATVRSDTPGAFSLTATATDAVGNQATDQLTLSFIDPSIVGDPEVSITSPSVDRIVTGPINIIGSVNDPDLNFYTLEVAPLLEGELVEFARGTTNVANGVLGFFDPTALRNGNYLIRLYAVDIGGNDTEVQIPISVAGNLKLGNFTLSFEDLSVPVSGIPITVARTYDSLNANEQGEFGFGWRLEFRDVQLRTSVAKTGFEQDLIYKPFRDGTRVYLTLPGGRREAFTLSVNPAPGLRGALGLHIAEFIPDPGVFTQLAVKQYELAFNINGELVKWGSNMTWNPASPVFGGNFYATTREGLLYEIDGTSGLLDRVIDTNSNTVTFTNDAVISSTGKRVTFERDPQRRITAVIDPLGNRIEYDYHASGDLISVTDREGNVTRIEYNEPTRAHYLTEVIDPLGRTGIRGEYDADGKLVKMFDADGNFIELVHDPANFVEVVRDQLGNPTTYEYDERGNVLREIDALNGVIERTYDDDNNELTVTDQLGNLTTMTYNRSGDVLTETNPLGNTTTFTYTRIQPTTEVAGISIGGFLKPHSLQTSIADPLGNTTDYGYDEKGNLLSIRDAANQATSFAYDGSGNLVSLDFPASGLTTLTYDAFGNQVSETDALDNTTTFTFDANGNQLTRTWEQTVRSTLSSLTSSNVYDADSRLVSTTDALGKLTQYEYDANGSQTARIDALGRRTESRFDDRGLLIETIYPDNTPGDISDNPRVKTEFDVLGPHIPHILEW